MLQATRRATPEATNAGRGLTPLDPAKREQKERGLFNFLTWPFLLAQMFAAEEFLSGGPRTAAADEERAKLANTGQNKGSGAEGDLPAASGSLRGASEDESSAVPETRLDPGDRGELRESRPLEPGPDERWATYKQDAAAGGGGSGGGGGGGESGDQAPANIDNTGAGLPDLASDADSSGAGPLGSASALSLLNPAGALPLQTLASLDPGSVIQSALPVIDGIGPLATAITNAANDVVADTVDSITSALTSVPQTLTGLVEPVNDIAGNVVQTVSSVVDGVAPALTAATDAATDLVANTVSGAAPILAAVPRALTGLVEPVNDIAGTAVQTFSSVVDGVTPVLTAATGAATDLVADTVSGVAPILAAAPQALTAVSSAAGNVVQGLEPILDATSPALAGITDAIDGLAAGALGSTSPIVQASGATLASAPGLIRDVGDQVLQIGSSTLDGIGTAPTATGEAVDGALGGVASLLDGITSTPAAAVESIGDVLQGAPPIVDSAGPAVTHVLDDIGVEMADTAIDWSQPVLSFGEAANTSSNAAGPELPVVSAEIVVDPLSADLSVRSGGETFASGGVIAFNSRDARDDAADPFGSDTHTPYGLALTINATEGARSPHAAADLDQGSSSKLPSLTDQGREHESSDGRGSDISHSTFGTVADLSSAMDDIGSRTGDLLL